MDRAITYVGESVYETLFSKPDQNTMVGLAKLSAAMLGTSTVVNGLACVPTGPASMQVVVGAGEIYQVAPLEATACGTLPQDTAHNVVKQGILLDAFTTANGALAAPGSSGQSIAYLLQVQYADSDVSIDPSTNTTPVVLQFYNSTNPTSPWSGPGGLGGTSNTYRKGVVSIVVKAGTAATTGSQVTPTPDSGFVGLWVVTVAFGQSSIVAGNITQYPGAPILPSSLLASIQNGNLSYAVATGTANAHVVALTPALTQRVDGMVIRYKAPAANNAALTLNDGLGAVAVVGGAHSALQGGETVTNGDVWVQWNSSIGGGSYIMLDSSGGASQIAPATQSQHAVQLGQVRIRLTANTTFFVNASTGSDSNNGLTSGTAWLTLQKAWNVIQQNYDLNGFNVTVSVANGTYGAVSANGYLVGSDGPSSVLFQGNTGSPASVIVSASSGNAAFFAFAGAQYSITGFTINTSGSANGVMAAQFSYITFSNVVFGSSAQAHLVAQAGGQISATGAYTISGGATAHLTASQSGDIFAASQAVTLTGTPAFSVAFALVQQGSNLIVTNATYTGSATGPRYNISTNAVVVGTGGVTTFFPGNAAGGTATGGQYT